MKRYMFLLFGLLGLVVLEWGCMGWGGSCDPIPDDNYKITGFDEVVLSSYQNHPVSDTMQFDNVKFEFYIISELVSNDTKLNKMQSGVYATDPCPPPAEAIITKFDSLKIATKINGILQEITSLFAINTQTYYLDGEYSYHWESLDELEALNYLNSIKNYKSPSLTLGLLRSPNVVLDSPITFQFFDTEGNVFETITDPIIITP